MLEYTTSFSLITISMIYLWAHWYSKDKQYIHVQQVKYIELGFSKVKQIRQAKWKGELCFRNILGCKVLFKWVSEVESLTEDVPLVCIWWTILILVADLQTKLTLNVTLMVGKHIIRLNFEQIWPSIKCIIWSINGKNAHNGTICQGSSLDQA